MLYFRLQFRSSSNSSTSPNSKSISSARSQSPLHLSASSPTDRSSGKVQSLQAPTNNQSKQTFVTNGYQFVGTNERPRSLPGLQVTTGIQESSKLSNLMSPPLCPPPKSANQMVKAIPQGGSSPIYADTGIPARGMSSISFLQTNGATSFPVLVPQSPQQVTRLPNQAQLPNQSQDSPGKRQILSQRTSLKRSDSCPYPSQSPRARQISVSQALKQMSPTQAADSLR